MYNLNLNLTESEKKRILSLHDSKNIKNKTISEQNAEQLSPTPPTSGKFKLPGINDQNFNNFLSVNSNDTNSLNLFTKSSQDALKTNPQQMGPALNFISSVLDFAAKTFPKSDEILGPKYDTILTNLYGNLNMQNYKYDDFIKFYFGDITKFKQGMKNLIDTKLKSLS